jgi:hypothetical protein
VKNNFKFMSERWSKIFRLVNTIKVASVITQRNSLARFQNRCYRRLCNIIAEWKHHSGYFNCFSNYYFTSISKTFSVIVFFIWHTTYFGWQKWNKLLLWRIRIMFRFVSPISRNRYLQFIIIVHFIIIW